MRARTWPGVALCAVLACAGGKRERRAERDGRPAAERGERDRRDGEARRAGRAGAPPARPGTRREAPDEPAEGGVPPRAGRPRVPASPEALLAPGAVGRIQEVLQARGYLAEAHQRGELDAATSRGIRRFQEDEGLAATGMPDRETLDRLGVSASAAYGREER